MMKHYYADGTPVEVGTPPAPPVSRTVYTKPDGPLTARAAAEINEHRLQDFAGKYRLQLLADCEKLLSDPENLALALRYWLLHSATELSVQDAIAAWRTVANLTVAGLKAQE